MAKLRYDKLSKQRDAVKRRAIEELWRRGEQLRRILDETQYDMYQKYLEFDRTIDPIFIFLCSRRLGKSVSCFGIADNHCRQNPGSRVLYLSKTSENLKEILDQAGSVILNHCPDMIKPTYLKKDQKFVYSNGSEIRFKGLDKTGPDVLRGIKSDLVLLDEFCFMDNLQYLLSSVLMPMVIETEGRILMASTPPIAPGHESINYIAKAEITGAIIKKTIYDCPRWTADKIEEFAREAGGFESDTFRREYMCEIITSRDRAIFPACTGPHVDKITTTVDRPTHYIPDHYIAIDPGGRDQTAILFAYWDFEEATLVVEDEVLIDESSTLEISNAIKKKLSGDWKGITPRKIVMDNNNQILIKDIKRMHSIKVVPTRKDKKEAQVNQTNIMLQNEQILIHPRCKGLLQQCRYGIWNKTRTSYERSTALSHCDAIDALVYMVRNIDRYHNPLPNFSFNPNKKVYHGDQPQDRSTSATAFKNIFGRK